MMIRIIIFNGGKIGLGLMIAATPFVVSGAAFAVSDRTWLVNASSGQVAAGGNCRYIVYYKNDDLYIQTEDSWNAVQGYLNTNAGYVLSGSPPKGFCQVDSTYYPDPDPASTDPYDIWISSIADTQAGHASGLVDDVPLGNPSYVPTGNSNGVPFVLASAGYLAEPGNIKESAGNNRVLVRWDAVAGATEYKVYRGPVSGVGVGNGIYQRIADTAKTYFEDTALTNGTTYYYIIYAYDATRRGVHTDQLQVTPDATAPSITLLNPNNGNPGTVYVTIEGSGFGSTQGTGIVMFNGVQASTFASWSDNQIVVLVPSNATAGNVYVINSLNKVSNGVLFTPVSYSISLSSGASGNYNWIAFPFTGTGLFTTTDIARSIGNTIPVGSRVEWVDVVEVKAWDAVNQQAMNYLCMWNGAAWDDGGSNAPLVIGGMYKVAVPNSANGLTWGLLGNAPANGSIQFTLKSGENWITTPAYITGISNTTDLARSIGNTIPVGSRLDWADIVEVRVWDAVNQQQMNYSCMWDGSIWDDSGSSAPVNVPGPYVVSVPASANGNIWP